MFCRHGVICTFLSSHRTSELKCTVRKTRPSSIHGLSASYSTTNCENMLPLSHQSVFPSVHQSQCGSFIKIEPAGVQTGLSEPEKNELYCTPFCRTNCPRKGQKGGGVLEMALSGWHHERIQGALGRGSLNAVLD